MTLAIPKGAKAFAVDVLIARTAREFHPTCNFLRADTGKLNVSIHQVAQILAVSFVVRGLQLYAQNCVVLRSGRELERMRQPSQQLAETLKRS